MKRILILLAFSFISLTVLAQNGFRGAYFMDGYLYGHTMNPALYANRGYLGIATGKADVQAQSNLGLSTFYTPSTSGNAQLFLNEEISSAQFLGKIHKNNLEDLNAQYDLFHLGFWTEKDRFHTLSISVKASERSNIPYDFFRFLKEGTTDGNLYDLGGFGGRARAYAQVAYGMSVPVTDEIRVGAKIKALVGLAYMDLDYSRMDLMLDRDRWTISSEASLVSSNIPSRETAGPQMINEIYNLDNYNWKDFRPSGYGAAIDLGATWQVLPWLQLSASLLDIGLIRWNLNNRMASIGNFDYTGFKDLDLSGEGSVMAQIDEVRDEVYSLARFQKAETGSPTDMLPITGYLGVKAQPCSWFSAGLLGTGRAEGKYSWAEIRGALNLEPTHWLGLTAGAAYGTFGPKLSSALNFRLALMSIFIGAEASSLHLAANMNGEDVRLKAVFDPNNDTILIPRDNLNMHLTFGVNMVFGRKIRPGSSPRKIAPVVLPPNEEEML